MDRSVHSLLQPPALAQSVVVMPRSDQVPPPHPPSVHEQPDPHQDAHSAISDWHRSQRNNNIHHTAAGATNPGQTIEGTGETRPRRSRRPDGWSPSPEDPGPRAFSWLIQKAPFPQRFRPPTNVTKYTRETNPGIWLEDFRLACRARGVDDDFFIIQYLPICVGEHVRAWLEFLPHDSIRDWADLKRVFVGNFLGMYVRPGNS